MRFGIAVDIAPLAPLAERLDYVCDLAQLARTSGFSSVWLGESFHTTDEPFHSSRVLLSLATIVSRSDIPVGTGVLLAPAYEPRVLVSEIRALQAISRARFSFGVGLGPRGLRKSVGISDGRRAGDVLDEVLALLYGGETSVAIIGGGAAGVPLYIGGRSPQMQERLKRYHGTPYVSTNHDDSRLQGVAEASGRGTAVNRICVISDTRERAWQLFDREFAEVVEYYSRRGLWPHEHPPPVLVGTPDDVRSRLMTYASWGVTEVQLRVAPRLAPNERAVRTLELFGSEVLPGLRTAGG
jgi:alkanesulfonate monooxygenase SsuD/methylene tetrahydromethanopterin reductase-like flavin-dependent oxidoreductase (luciferase family)